MPIEPSCPALDDVLARKMSALLTDVQDRQSLSYDKPAPLRLLVNRMNRNGMAVLSVTTSTGSSTIMCISIFLVITAVCHCAFSRDLSGQSGLLESPRPSSHFGDWGSWKQQSGWTTAFYSGSARGDRSGAIDGFPALPTMLAARFGMLRSFFAIARWLVLDTTHSIRLRIQPASWRGLIRGIAGSERKVTIL